VCDRPHWAAYRSASVEGELLQCWDTKPRCMAATGVTLLHQDTPHEDHTCARVRTHTHTHLLRHIRYQDNAYVSATKVKVNRPVSERAPATEMGHQRNDTCHM
jgi:hypothetical protein